MATMAELIKQNVEKAERAAKAKKAIAKVSRSVEKQYAVKDAVKGK